MPTSSSVNPELGVVTAANLLSVYAAAPSRDTDAEAFVSSLRTQDEVDALCDMYGVPKEFTARLAGDLRANSTPPPGAICVYASALKAGMRVPLHRFFREVLAHFGIAPAQLTPNGWRAMAGFLALCHSAGMDPSVHDMMKTMLAEKAAAQASASASAKKRTWEEARGGEEVSPEHFPSRYDRDTTKAARELLHLHDADAHPLERAFATDEPSVDAAIRQAANYALELEQKLVARERQAAALREQLEKAKNELAAAKRAADAEREKAGAELETTKAELAAANQAAEAEAVKMKAELAAAVAEALKTKVKMAKANAELAGANRAVDTELVKTKAKLAAAEAELKAAATVQELLASEEKVRRRAELALEGYQRWRGRHAPAGRAA